MKLERRSLSRLALPLKALVDRFAFAILVVLSIALLALGRADVHVLGRIGATIGDVVTPALEVLTQPIAASRRLVEGVGELVALRDENARLRDAEPPPARLAERRPPALARERGPAPGAQLPRPTPSGRPRSPAA